MTNWLWVALGGAAGSVARYGLGVQASRWLGTAWPYGTFIANIVGGFLIGLLAGWLAHRGGADHWRLLLGVGVLGGFTTFSAFSLETAGMIQRGDWGGAAAYAVFSAALAIAAVFAGLMLARGAFA